MAPSDEGVLAELERLAGEADEWGVVAGLYAKRLAALTSGRAARDAAGEQERRSLLRRSLRVAASKLQRPAEARGFAEALLADDPADEEAQAALEQILTQMQAWPNLAALLHGRAERTTDVGERAKLLFRIAQIEEEKANDLAAAARTYGAIVDLDPTSEAALRALRALGRILETREDWAGLVQALRRELAVRAPQATAAAGQRSWRRRRAWPERMSGKICCCASATSKSTASATWMRRSPPIATC